MKEDFLNYFSIVLGILNFSIIGSFHYWFLKDCIQYSHYMFSISGTFETKSNG